jgi:hypothetical protein
MARYASVVGTSLAIRMDRDKGARGCFPGTVRSGSSAAPAERSAVHTAPRAASSQGTGEMRRMWRGFLLVSTIQHGQAEDRGPGHISQDSVRMWAPGKGKPALSRSD